MPKAAGEEDGKITVHRLSHRLCVGSVLSFATCHSVWAPVSLVRSIMHGEQEYFLPIIV